MDGAREPSVALALVVLAAAGAVLIGAVAPTAAHETRTVEGYDLTFGGEDEPLVTGERMWLELEIVENRTGEPVTNQSGTLNVTVQLLGIEGTDLEVDEDDPGVYRAAVIFTEPGEYVVHVEGSLEGTEVHVHFETTVEDHTDLEYPAAGSSDGGDEGNESEQVVSGTVGAADRSGTVGAVRYCP